MDRRKFLATVGGTAVPLLAGCGGGGKKTPTTEIAATIEIRSDGKFHPQTVSISTGEGVKWVNKSSQSRGIRATNVQGAKNWEFSADMEANGGSVRHAFSSPGVYAFHDSLNTQFVTCGAVAVGDASVDSVNLPCTM